MASSRSAIRLPSNQHDRRHQHRPMTRYWSCVRIASSVMRPRPGQEKMISAMNEPETSAPSV